MKDKSGLLIEDSEKIVELLINHLKKIGLSKGIIHKDIINELILHVITEGDNSILTRIPDQQEIKNTLFSMNQWGAPGPDDFPPGFFKEHWDFFAQDITNLVQEFFRNKNMNEQLNNSCITLIAEVQNPSNPSDFRPIILINTTYKLISKILANRLKPFLDKMIPQNQSAFIPGR